jgi:(E)-4-hydroxy-3-methylbut-2-enyl-diphosphate synthase
VRVTAPSIRDAENLREIRAALAARGVEVPLVADIHFTPNAAMIAAEVVEKVRINPGNYADKKKFEVREYDDREYAAELERVAERFRPLVRRCRDNGVAMRIGTNHGSLSDRIMNRFGDTAEGMVESALEFLDVCEDEGYRDVVFSMKASNTQVAIQAYRLLAARLEARTPGEPSYPFHVGVTEAGDAEDGRIKSAIGIGALLEDGLGDTIRVSLTEDPVREVPVAREIANRVERIRRLRAERVAPIEVRSGPIDDYFAPSRRPTRRREMGGLACGGDEPVRVELDLPEALDAPEAAAARLALELSALRDVACESLLVGGAGALERVGDFAKELATLGLDIPLALRVGPSAEALESAAKVAPAVGRWVVRVATPGEASRWPEIAEAAGAAGVDMELELEAVDHALPSLVAAAFEKIEGSSLREPSAVSLAPEASLHDYRVLAAALADHAKEAPLVVLRQAHAPTGEAALIDASVKLGGLLCDGLGDVVSIRPGSGPDATAIAVDLAYRILQGARQRTTRTEYISCPSCGRTLFDLEETTARIKSRTDHLSGVKIAVMGCIVNGPGEMADADFGYVGSGEGQVTLYVGKDVVARAVPEGEATDRLVDLIRDHGRWRDPEAAD